MATEPKKPASGEQGLSPKQLAAQARAESEAAERRRERLIRIIGGIAVLAIVAGLLAIGFFAGRGDSSASDGAPPPPQPDPSAALPAGVTSDTYGVRYGAGWTAAGEERLPTLEIWEDFQCPVCAQLEKAAGADIEKLADEGLVKLLYRPAIFLDVNPTVQADNLANGNPNSSARATSAWGCAVDQGKISEFHNAVFAAQPADEGVGYSDQQLIDLGAQIGVADTAAYTTCVQEGTYLGWAANSNQKFADSGATGTPTGFLNGVELNGAELADIEGLKQKIAAATAQ